MQNLDNSWWEALDKATNPDHEEIAIWTPESKPQTDALTTLADELYYGGSAGGGKALDLDTPLPTPGGWTTMRDVKPGDALIDVAGNPCKVIATSDVQHGRDCYEVVFSDGSRIVADSDHKWQTLDVSERGRWNRCTPEFRAKRRATRPKRGTGKRPDLAKTNSERKHDLLEPSAGSVRTTKEILETLQVGKHTNHSVDVCGALALPDASLLIDPYVMGVWLGDGTTVAGSITTVDADVLEEVGQHYQVTNRDDITYGLLGLQVDLREVGVLGNKHIPAEYLRASHNQRLALLQGLMDTDGYCDKRGQCEFTTIKPPLRDGFVELLGTLGIKAVATEGRATLNGRDCGPKYRIKFITSLQAFRLPVKLDRQKRDGFRGTHNRRYIVDVKPVDSVAVKCVAVDSESHLYLAGRSFIPTHNTDLLLGLAITAHHSSIIFRREYAQLQGAEGIIERSRQLLKPPARFNGQTMLWRNIPGNRLLEFGACQFERDVQRYQGRAHDLKSFDELTHFTKFQYQYLSGWNRTTIPGQRCRTVATGNPPMDPEGEWVIERWAAWLDNQHDNPAEPGELRWYAMIDDEEVERENGDHFEWNGDTIEPRSRTFIPASLEDNPFLRDTGYKATVQSLPEPMRSKMLYGDHSIGFEDDPWQAIPTAWVIAAQDRWTPEQPNTPLSAIGVDVARGGKDQTVLAKRYDNWYAELEKLPGSATPDGPAVAGLVVVAKGSQAPRINVDVIGVGSSVYDTLILLNIDGVSPVNFAEGTDNRDESGQLGFMNKRAEFYWRMREALDPTSGQDIALPPDRELRADLCAPKWEPTPRGIKIESKEQIQKRIGRSTDCGDAVVLARYAGDYHGIGV
jgi:hypothetical protein